MSNEQTIRTLYDALNRRDFDKVMSLFADDAQFNDVSGAHVYRGPKEIRAMTQEWLNAIPDMKMQISQVIASGDSCVAEYVFSGTHNGTLATPQGPLTATGKRVTVPVCDTFKLRGEKIASTNCYFPSTLLLSQIGAMPQARQAA